MREMQVPQGSFILDRLPLQKDKSLRAWDSADEYILNHLADSVTESAYEDKLLVVNDAFGALSVALSSLKPDMVTDSFLSQQATYANFRQNNINTELLDVYSSLQPLSKVYDLVVIKVPKKLSMLEDQLCRLKQYCHSETVIVAAGMVKHIHTSTLSLFENILGTTRTSLAKKKSRLIFPVFNNDNESHSPYPVEYLNEVTGDTYINHANVFSGEKLDIGTRFMLAHLPGSGHYRNIVDLACGNGVLGIEVAKLNPEADIYFLDESYMAVDSARINSANIIENNNCHFMVTDCLQGLENDFADLVLNNPPFHQDHAIGDFIAWQMFKESRNKLKQGGELWVVGNRHLGYHAKLKRLFGNSEQVASNKKFVIVRAIKQ